MAFMSKERKAEIAPAVKTILNRYGLNGTLSVRDHSTLVLTIRSGEIDFITNYRDAIMADRGRIEPWQLTDHIEVNHYHVAREFTGEACEAITALVVAMNNGNWDKSDVMTDYFNVGWYIDVKIGTWNKAYEHELAKVGA